MAGGEAAGARRENAMTEPVQIALITGAMPVVAIIVSRIISSMESRKTNVKLDATKTIAKEIAGELKPNGGKSTKDLVANSAESIGEIQRTLKEELARAASERAKTEEDLANLELRFERKVVHDGRGDVGSTTRLFKEAEIHLEKVDREAREAREAQERALEHGTTFD